MKSYTSCLVMRLISFVLPSIDVKVTFIYLFSFLIVSTKSIMFNVVPKAISAMIEARAISSARIVIYLTSVRVASRTTHP
jgi:hypothetical protein